MMGKSLGRFVRGAFGHLFNVGFVYGDAAADLVGGSKLSELDQEHMELAWDAVRKRVLPG